MPRAVASGVSIWRTVVPKWRHGKRRAESFKYQSGYTGYLWRLRSRVMSAMNARERSAHSKAIADQIKAERARRGLIQEEVYKPIGMARATYIRIENGTRVADVTQLSKIADLFGMPLSLLVARAEAELAREAENGSTSG